MPVRIGSLFSGYGGLEMGVRDALGGRVVWHAEIDRGPSAILEHHWPGVPNLGDVAAVDWPRVEPVDVLTGGFPCQDVSAAGRRAGITAGSRSGLWARMAEAVAQLRPGMVVIENVRGLLSASAEHPAHSDLESCPWCVGGGDPVLLRALGAVLGDLADIGYDARWTGLPASAVGAPHGRFRVFVVARPAADPDRVGHERGGRARHGRTRPADRTVTATDPDCDGLEGVGRLHTVGRDPDRRGGPHTAWGPYESAVRRWEAVLGRAAPAPTEAGTRGGSRLAPAFVEWMMGLPAGHVTGVPGLSRAEQLRALGNGVVPQQAAAAVAALTGQRAAATA